MRVKIQVHDIGLSLTQTKYNRGERYVGTAILSDVNIKDGICTGELVGEYLEEYPLAKSNLPAQVWQSMKPLTDKVRTAKVVYAVGKKMFYIP